MFSIPRGKKNHIRLYRNRIGSEAGRRGWDWRGTKHLETSQHILKSSKPINAKSIHTGVVRNSL